MIYKNEQTDQTITFEQWVKPECDYMRLNTEKGKLVEVEINGYSGVTLDLSKENQDLIQIIWDNGDYLLYISGDIPQNELLVLAKSAKILETTVKLS